MEVQTGDEICEANHMVHGGMILPDKYYPETLSRPAVTRSITETTRRGLQRRHG